jgi:folate-binding protein YgfZ
LATAAFDGGRVLRLDEQRWVIVVDSTRATALWTVLSSQATPAGRDAWLWHDIQAGLPLVTLATKEAFVPQMVNFEKIGGVSFNKGCYPGQEIVARTQYLGKVKRHMHRGHSATEFQIGDELFSPAVPDQACGRIAMIVPAPGSGWDVLAVVQENAVATPIAVGTENGPTFTVAPQPACEVA